LLRPQKSAGHYTQKNIRRPERSGGLFYFKKTPDTLLWLLRKARGVDIFCTRRDANNKPKRKAETMNRYQPRVSGTVENGFYTLIVRVDKDGTENVIHGYQGRHFKTRKAGIRSAERYIAKNNLN
jgi:hypothetical protein